MTLAVGFAETPGFKPQLGRCLHILMSCRKQGRRAGTLQASAISEQSVDEVQKKLTLAVISKWFPGISNTFTREGVSVSQWAAGSLRSASHLGTSTTLEIQAFTLEDWQQQDDIFYMSYERSL